MSFSDNFTKYKNENSGYLRLPEPPLDEVRAKYKVKGKTNDDVLRELSRIFFKKGVEKGIIPSDKEEQKKYVERIKLELDLYKELFFTDYVLLIFCIIEKAREHNVFIDHGRGSCVGSLIFYILEITGVDPIKTGLFFERFVSKTRAKSKVDKDGNVWLQADLVPDADLNLGEGRAIVLDWLRKIYPNRIGKILTVFTLSGKALIKDCYKIIEEVSEDEANRISKLIERKFGIVGSLEETYENNEEFRTWADDHKQVFETAKRLENINRQTGVHASGYLVGETDLGEMMPLQKDASGDIISGYTMKFVPAIKVDLLGLTTNTIVRNVLDSAKINVLDINLVDDPFIYEKFQDGKLLPYGLYQISGDCAYRVCKSIKPVNVGELSDVNAIARPGALAYEKDYVGNTGICPNDLFKDVLDWTRFQPLYQEQIIKMAVKLGFSPDEGEQLRRVIGKKLVEEVKEWKAKIYAKCEENDISPLAADAMWKLAEDSAKYSFNLSHSMATSFISALTVYLKYKYPVKFYIECLNDAAKNSAKPQEDIGMILQELPFFNIQLLPPSLIKSAVDFTEENGNIRYGLRAVKGVSGKTMEAVVKLKGEYKTKIDFFDTAEQLNINVGVLSALIQAGTLQDFGTKRTSLVLECQLWNLLTDKEKKKIREISSVEGNVSLVKTIKALNTTKDEKGKNTIIKDSRYETIKKKYLPYREIYDKNSDSEAFANWWYEYIILAFPYSTNLNTVFNKNNPNILPIKEVKEFGEGNQVLFAGIVQDVFNSTSKKGNKYCKITIKDEGGTITVLLFDNARGSKIDQCKEMNNGKLPKENDVVIVKGKLTGEGALFADVVSVQSSKIYMKLGDLKKEKAEEEKEKVDKK